MTFLGPCPIISIANALLLSNRLHISTDRAIISLEEIQQLLFEVCFENSDERCQNNPNLSQLLADVVNILPKVSTGLDINICFDKVNHFEFTEDIASAF